MVVTKILEAILYAGSSSVTFTDSEIPNSLLRIYSNDNSMIYKSATLSGNTVTVTYDPQLNNKNIALEIVKSGLDIVDDLLSTDNSKALSANQGRALKSLIDGIVIPTSYPADDITYDNSDTGLTAENVQDALDEVFTNVSDGKVLLADAITDKGVETSADDTFATMAENISEIPTGGGGGGDATVVLTQIKPNNNAAAAYSYTATESCKLIVLIFQNTGSSNPNLSVKQNGTSISTSYTNVNGTAHTYQYDIATVSNGDIIAINFQNSGIYISGAVYIIKYGGAS